MQTNWKKRTALAVLATGIGFAGALTHADITVWAQEKPWIESSGTLGKADKILSDLPDGGRLEKSDLEKLVEIGGELFKAKFTTLEGAGRPNATQAIIPTKRRNRGGQMFARTSGLDANACSSCHNDPVVGGAGDFATTVFVSEGFTNSDFDSTDPQFSNERGTNHLFGAGLIELLAREMTRDLQDIRKRALREARSMTGDIEVELKSKGVSFGKITAHADGIVDLSKVEGVDTDLVVRPFSQKGVMTSLRQFTVNAANHHHGIQASERFGARWTGSDDHDGDKHQLEMSDADVSALVAWQATLPVPVEITPENPEWKTMAKTGSTRFDEIGCASCHRRSLPLDSLAFQDPGPVDVSGTLNHTQVKQTTTYDLALLEWAKKLPRNDQGQVLVPLFGDLKRHTMTDRRNEALGNELLSQRFVDRNIFLTSELWGVGSTAPYGHRNDFTTLDAIIRAHGGNAAASKDAYVEASEKDRTAIIAFLKTLRIEE